MVSGTTSTAEPRIPAAFREALAQVPKLNQEEVETALAGGEPLKLTSKQTNIVVSHLNRFLRSKGLAPITAKELIRKDLKPTQNGCLDPCEGSTSDRLMGLVGSRFKGVSAGL